MAHPELQDLFNVNTLITAEYMKGLLKPAPFMSRAERIALNFFMEFVGRAGFGTLRPISDSYRITTENIHQWLTGSTVPFRRAPQISLSFHPDDDENPDIIPRPVVKTCYNSLVLPLTDTYQNMELVCNEAVLSAIQKGFTMA